MNHFSTPNYGAPNPTPPEQIHLPPYSPKTRPLSQDIESANGSSPAFIAPPPYQSEWTVEDSYAQWQHSQHLDTPRQQYLSRRHHTNRRLCFCLFLSLFFITVFVVVAVIEIVGRTQQSSSSRQAKQTTRSSKRLTNMVTIIEPTLVSRDEDPMDPFRQSPKPILPNHSPGSSTANSALPQHPSTACLDPRTNSPPEIEPVIIPQTQKHPLHLTPRSHDLEAANTSPPTYTEFYAPAPSTAYYSPISSLDVYNHEGGTVTHPYSDRYGNTRHNPKRESRPWVWEYSSWWTGYNGEGWSPRLCGFRTRNMPPSQIACLLIPSVTIFVILIVVIAAVVVSMRR